MSLKPKVAELLRLGFKPREIAEWVGCTADYVRAVRHREKHGGICPADKRWNEERMRMYHALPSDRRRDIYATAYRSSRQDGCDRFAADIKAKNQVSYEASVAHFKSKEHA